MVLPILSCCLFYACLIMNFRNEILEKRHKIEKSEFQIRDQHIQFSRNTKRFMEIVARTSIF